MYVAQTSINFTRNQIKLPKMHKLSLPNGFSFAENYPLAHPFKLNLTSRLNVAMESNLSSFPFKYKWYGLACIEVLLWNRLNLVTCNNLSIWLSRTKVSNICLFKQKVHKILRWIAVSEWNLGFCWSIEKMSLDFGSLKSSSFRSRKY